MLGIVCGRGAINDDDDDDDEEEEEDDATPCSIFAACWAFDIFLLKPATR
jgi:hypothetical protein